MFLECELQYNLTQSRVWGGVKSLVFGPLVEEHFFAASLTAIYEILAYNLHMNYIEDSSEKSLNLSYEVLSCL